MFEVSPHRKFPYNTPIISTGYRELLSDDIPILYTGRNEMGLPVIGLLVNDYPEKKLDRYYHIVLNEDEYSDYFGGKVTVLELINKTSPLFIVDKYHKTNRTLIYHYQPDEIPNIYKPGEQSFIPKSAYRPTSVYTVPIKGGTADSYRAFYEDVAKSESRIGKFIETGLATLIKKFSVRAKTFSVPATQSSYGLNFEVSIDSYPEMFISKDECFDYLNHFVSYCIEHLPEEAENLNSGTHKDTHFNSLVQKAVRLGLKFNSNEQEIRDAVLEDVLETPKLLKEVATIIRQNYSSLRISNNDMPLGTIDRTFEADIGSVMEYLAQVQADMTEEDETVNEYEIHVYQFNKNTGSGWAYIKQPDETMPSIAIGFQRGKYDPSVSAEKFTGSEHESKFINVNGKVKRIHGRLSKLTIYE